MLTKTDPDEIQPFLSDASYLRSGAAEAVVFPESPLDIAEVLKGASASRTPVTISGAGTGTVAGRVPCGGLILATDKLSHIQSISRNETGASAVAEAGVRLADLQQFVETQGLIYPPDPTERTCYLGGTIATNASGSRTFKYGPTRNYIRRLKIVLATGDVLDLRRNDLKADAGGRISIALQSRALEAQLPTYQMPRTRKHACGYFVAPEMDVIDLFIGSEGTLGVIVEAEVELLPKPQGLLSGVVFFDSDEHVLSFAREIRSLSMRSRAAVGRIGKFGALMEKALSVTANSTPLQSDNDHPPPLIDARALEYFDHNSLDFLRSKYDTIPEAAIGAIFFEQETNPSNEEELIEGWLAVVERHSAMSDSSWFATNESDHTRLREFRHALPVLMNEWFARHKQRKVSTDMSVPDEAFDEMLRFYHDTLRPTGLRYTVFGHIGDNHVHVNILPRDDREAAIAKDVYVRFVKRAIEVGGTLSAEHGVGKLKREYLKLMYTEENLREMAALKRAFDPAGILGRGNMFSEDYLS